VLVDEEDVGRMAEDGKSASEDDNGEDLPSRRIDAGTVTHIEPPTIVTSESSDRPSTSPNTTDLRQRLDAGTDADALVSSMSSLALVPPSVRFGRGASRQGFPPRRATSMGTTAMTTFQRVGSEDGLEQMDAEFSTTSTTFDGRGRGGRTFRGRGRGRGRGSGGEDLFPAASAISQ